MGREEKGKERREEKMGMERKGRGEEKMRKWGRPKDLLKWRHWLFEVVLLLYEPGYVAGKGRVETLGQFWMPKNRFFFK